MRLLSFRETGMVNDIEAIARAVAQCGAVTSADRVAVRVVAATDTVDRGKTMRTVV